MERVSNDEKILVTFLFSKEIFSKKIYIVKSKKDFRILILQLLKLSHYNHR